MIDVSRLHFLVHPGYFLMIRRYTQPENEPFSTRSSREERSLLEVYKGKIDSLGSRDVLVISSPSDSSTYAKDVRDNEEWLSAERYAKGKIGKRCIALSNPDFLSTAKKSNSLDIVRLILAKRGFGITRETPCEVWGQEADQCVVDTAEAVFKKLKLKSFPEIPSDSTNFRGFSAGEIEALEKNLRLKHPKVRVVKRV